MNYFKDLISSNKKLFIDRIYKLDLSYITPRLIVMSYPKSFYEKLLTKSTTDVANFLNQRHGNKYLIINLNNTEYDTSRFHGSVLRCIILHHLPPLLKNLFLICSKIHKYLSEDVSNVVVINCVGEKGRIGSVVSCYLLYSGKFENCEDSFIYYSSKRLFKGEGITQKNQRRYVQYFKNILYEKKKYFPFRIKIKSILLKNLNEVYNKGYYYLELMNFNNGKWEEFYFSPNNFKIDAQEKSVKINFENLINKEQFGDVAIKISYKEYFSAKKLGKICFNTAFLESDKDVLTFKPNEIDPESLLNKNRVPKDYQIEIYYTTLCPNCREIGDKYCEECNKFFDSNQKLLENWKEVENYKNEYLDMKVSYNKNILFGNIDSDDGEYILENYKNNKIKNKDKNKNIITEDDNEDEKSFYEENNDSNSSDENSDIDEVYMEKDINNELNKKKDKLNDSFDSECIII